MIIAAQHVGDSHHRIIDGIAKEKRRGAVVAANDEITDVVRQESLRSVHRIDEFDDQITGYGKSERGLQPPRLPLGALCSRQMPAGSRVARRLARHALQLARQLQFLRRAVAGVGLAVRRQLLEQGSVEFAALRLGVRGRRAADLRPLIPVQAQPPHVRDQFIAKTHLATLDIRVFDAQDEAPAALARPKMAEKGRPRVSQVQRTRRAGGKPRDDRPRIEHFGHISRLYLFE